MKSYEEAVGLIYWDMRTGAPRKGIATRSEVVGELSGELFKMSVSDEMGAFLDYFASPEVNDRLDPLYRKIVSECRKEYDRSKKNSSQTLSGIRCAHFPVGSGMGSS